MSEEQVIPMEDPSAEKELDDLGPAVEALVEAAASRISPLSPHLTPKPVATAVVFHTVENAQYPMGAAKLRLCSMKSVGSGKGAHANVTMQFEPADVADFLWLLAAPGKTYITVFPGYVDDLVGLLEGEPRRAIVFSDIQPVKEFFLDGYSQGGELTLHTALPTFQVIGFSKPKPAEPKIVADLPVEAEPVVAEEDK